MHLLQIKCVFIVLKDFPDDSCNKLILSCPFFVVGNLGVFPPESIFFMQSYHGFPSIEMAPVGAAALPG